MEEIKRCGIDIHNFEVQTDNVEVEGVSKIVSKGIDLYCKKKSCPKYNQRIYSCYKTPETYACLTDLVRALETDLLDRDSDFDNFTKKVVISHCPEFNSALGN